MKNKDSNYSLLLSRLDAFIRKYYLNKIYKGILLSITVLITSFLFINIVEYYFFLSTNIRTYILYSFLGISLAILIFWIVIPLLQYLLLGNRLSYYQAADIIGKHFSEVQDKLINILQLHSSKDIQHSELIHASINQKISDLSYVSFKNAIDLKTNLRYLKYVLPPVCILLFILFFYPRIVAEGSNRLVRYNTHFEKPVHFSFVIDTTDLSVIQYENKTISVHIRGTDIPAQVYILYDGDIRELKKENDRVYTYTFNNVSNDVHFQIKGNDFHSKLYTLKVQQKPRISTMRVDYIYPSYLKMPNLLSQEISDVYVPRGTRLIFNIETENADKLILKWSGGKDTLLIKDNKKVRVQKKIYAYLKYTMIFKNDKSGLTDSIWHNVEVIDDIYPSIEVEAHADSTNKDIIFYSGFLSDDYGLSDLKFVCKIARNNTISSYKYKNIEFDKSKRNTSFTYMLDFKEYNLNPSDVLEYYFEVWDNDVIRGNKSTKSNLFTHKIPSKEALDLIIDKSNKRIQKDLSMLMDQSNKLKEALKNIREKLIDKPSISWSDKNQIRSLLNQQKNIENQIQKINTELNTNLDNKNQYTQFDKQILDKQRKIQELFEQSAHSELKAYFKKLDSLLQKGKKEDILKNIDDIHLTDKQMNTEMDRMLSLFKQLEFEQKVNKVADKLDKLADKQKKLDAGIKDQKIDQLTAEEEQKKINKAYENIENEINDIEQNEKFKSEDIHEIKQDIQDALKQSLQDIQQQQNQQTDSPQKASEAMKKMSSKLLSMMQMMLAEKAGENMESIRKLLDNIVQLSFDQEENIHDIQNTPINSPLYVKKLQNQFKIKEDFAMVYDTLIALSNRVVEIKSFIFKETDLVNKNIEESISYLENRNKYKGSKHQQYVMTSLNNLALMLSEALQNIQQQMSNQMPGNKMCNKPGKKPGKQSLKQMQSEINKQIKDIEKQMKAGKSISKELAKTIAQQAAIRNRIKELQSKEKDGKLRQNMQKIINDIDKNEQDLANKKLTNELLKRQQNIETRLLEFDKAQKEKEKKRISNTAQNKKETTSPILEQYLKKREAMLDKYKKTPIDLHPFYKKMVEQYFNILR